MTEVQRKKLAFVLKRQLMDMTDEDVIDAMCPNFLEAIVVIECARAKGEADRQVEERTSVFCASEACERYESWVEVMAEVKERGV